MNKITSNKNPFQQIFFWFLIFTAVFSFTKTTAQNNIKLDYKLESKKANANYFDILKLKKQEIASSLKVYIVFLIFYVKKVRKV